MPRWCCLLVALVVTGCAASAPTVTRPEPAPRDDRATALARVPTGSTLRVLTMAGDVIEGPFRLAGDTVVLESDAGRRAIAIGEVRAVWRQQRWTRGGATTGALVAGAAGAAYLGFFGLITGGSGGEIATMFAIGGLGGAAAGGLLGGVVGAAVPRWTLVYPAGGEDRPALAPPTDRVERQPGRRLLGSVEGAAGYGRVGGDESSSGGAGGRLALHAEVGAEPGARGVAPFVTVGPEIGHFELGSTDVLRRELPQGGTLELQRGYSATTAGGVLRGGADVGGWRAYGLLGLAYNRWDIDETDHRWVGPPSESPPPTVHASRFEHLGYTVGAGTQRTLVRRAAVGLELRRTAVRTFDMDLPGSYWTVTLTAARRW